uniref:Peptidyl-prolyl cis-trans isomerase n=1 Tax=Euglena gracilis TaxID=3039 RepID=A0AA51UAL1_EUGGR|nr:peptidyl-prolyl cis-trans isomerase-like 3 [Euglena gracilis]BDX17146.1 RING-type E3 ubiquitin-protein ligase PPIL3A [Euglena gracilis]|eukprot:EG_transcript_27809
MSLTLHTTLGDLKLELHCSLVPKTAENFLALCASGYYDGTKFHRSVKNFIVQGGDPTGTGKGGTSIWGTHFADEFVPGQLKHSGRGVVSMANSGPDTNGSQFFITYSKQSHLNGTNTVFGKLIHGWETLEKMERAPVDANDCPVHDIVITKVTIHANPIAEREQG